MNEGKKISIIIPTYNAENTINRAINSLLEQYYKNIEIIIIDDGSTDSTVNKVKLLQKNDNRIILICKENTGVSDTRNVGLKNASGDYIGFLDADDYVERDMYTKMASELEKNYADICICSYYEVLNGNKMAVYFPWNEAERAFEGKDIYNLLIPLYIAKLKNEKSSIWGTVWRTLIKKEIACNIMFNKEISIAEDLIYLIDVYIKSNKVVALNQCLYNYVRTKNSSIGKYKKDIKETNKKLHIELLKRLNKINFFPKNAVRYGMNRFSMYTTSISNICKNVSYKFKDKRYYIAKEIKEFNTDKYISKKIFSELDFQRKIIFILMKFNMKTIVTVLFSLKERRRRC